MSGQTIVEAPRERSRGRATHWQEQRAKSSQSVVARNDGNALRDREICRVVEEERAAALLEAATVEENHGGQGAGAAAALLLEYLGGHESVLECMSGARCFFIHNAEHTREYLRMRMAGERICRFREYMNAAGALHQKARLIPALSLSLSLS